MNVEVVYEKNQLLFRDDNMESLKCPKYYTSVAIENVSVKIQTVCAKHCT